MAVPTPIVYSYEYQNSVGSVTSLLNIYNYSTFSQRSYGLHRNIYKPSIDVVPIEAAACVLHLAACIRRYGHFARDATLIV